MCLDPRPLVLMGGSLLLRALVVNSRDGDWLGVSRPQVWWRMAERTVQPVRHEAEGLVEDEGDGRDARERAPRDGDGGGGFQPVFLLFHSLQIRTVPPAFLVSPSQPYPDTTRRPEPDRRGIAGRGRSRKGCRRGRIVSVSEMAKRRLEGIQQPPTHAILPTRSELDDTLRSHHDAGDVHPHESRMRTIKRDPV